MTTPFHIIEARRQAAAFLHEREQQAHDVFLSTDRAAAYVGCPTRRAFLMWAKRSGIVLLHRGRRVVVSRRDLEAEIHRQSVSR